MRRVLTVLAVAMAAMVPVRANASPVILDPIIGVRGLPLGDSAIMPDSSPQPFGPCAAALGLPSGYICSDYEISSAYASGIFSVDLLFADPLGPIPTSALTLDTAWSDFITMTALDAFTVRLSGGSAAGKLSCGSPIAAAALPCSTQNDAVVFISPLLRGDGPFTVSMTGINEVSTVPEPASLVLLASGLGALARNRLRRRG